MALFPFTPPPSSAVPAIRWSCPSIHLILQSLESNTKSAGFHICQIPFWSSPPPCQELFDLFSIMACSALTGAASFIIPPSRGEAGKREAKARPILFHDCGITNFWKETHILISFCTDAKHITASNELGIKVFLWTLVSFQSLFEPIYTRPKVTSNVVEVFVFTFVHVFNWKIFKTLGLQSCWLALTSCHSLFTSCASLPEVSLPHTHPHA